MEAQISPRELAARLQEPNPPLLLDVRERFEHEFVALPNSKLVPLGELPQRIGELETRREEPIIVYCHHGMRSLHAISMLREAGFSKLQNLSGGIDEWSREVDPKLPRY